MGMKIKHSKQLKKQKAKRLAEKQRREPEIDFDTSAYVIYNRLELTYPCLSFDIVKDDVAQDVSKFPLTLNMIAGAQTPPHVENNYIYVMKVDGIKALKQENENEEDEEEEDDNEDDSGMNDVPNLTSVRVQHKGCVNRLRVNKINGRVFTASWSDKGKVHIYDLTTSVQAVSDQRSIKTYTAQKIEPKPIFTFGGHLTEGFALDWSRLRSGSLATGDCKKGIHVWTMRATDWNVDQQPLVGHENSVEDIKWSPEEAEVLASCSVDKSIRIWDLRQQATSRCVVNVLDSHKSDVNVIDWNTKSKNLIVSGGDDGVVKVWDLRYLKREGTAPFPVAQFDYHKKPITSVEWNPHDDTVMAVSSEDDRLTLWDLAVEKDEEQEQADEMEVDDGKKKSESDESSSSSSDEEDEEDDDDDDMDDDDQQEDEESKVNEDEGVEYGDLDLKKIPEQMLFLHQGQVEIKELHWHPQMNGLLLSTALNGINIFKTISA
uniref:Glutamate-rich WD repeat-containing protein 1 n=1 Tax=Aceria tosichella TaxID=561515 RepID=A0A6G1SN46_9ACAR